MKKIILFLLVILSIDITTVLANQLAHSTFGEGVTELIEVYSDENFTAYIGEDAVIANLVYGQYRENGKLKATIYLRTENEKTRLSMIKYLNKLIDNNKVDFYRADPNGLQYMTIDLFRDPTNNALTVHQESYFNDYYYIIGDMDTLIGLHTIEYTYDLDNNKEKLIMKILQHTDGKLGQLKNNPKYNPPY